MIDHLSIAVRDLQTSAAFYAAILGPLELTRLVERPHTIGFGKRYPEIWLNARPGMVPIAPDTGAHIALRAPSPEAVTAFHTAALASGGRCDGPPGPRQAAMTTYFGAFIRDLDGNRVEAVHFPPAPKP
ncbi:MAG TPA: VOC family protein [Hyphomicrobiaceae bacterium]|nr:VOC family protein [Hyphomicrobiaceae bacterium]